MALSVYLQIGLTFRPYQKIKLAWHNIFIVVAGGFMEEYDACSNESHCTVRYLSANHEEADTRIVLHAIHCQQTSGVENIVVSARDTAVLVMLLVHLRK